MSGFVTVGLVALGGLIGAPARYHLDRVVLRRTGGAFPWGTLVVNLLGCLLLGALTRLALGGTLYALTGVGFCGAFTTYSTFAYETLRLVEDGARSTAVVNVVLQVGCGLLVAALGWTLASMR